MNYQKYIYTLFPEITEFRMRRMIDDIYRTLDSFSMTSSDTASDLTDNAVIRGDGTNSIQGSGVTLDDSNNMTFPSGKYIAVNYLYDSSTSGYFLFRNTGAPKSTQLLSGPAYVKISDDSISIVNGPTGATMTMDSDGDSYISGVTFEATGTNGNLFGSDVSSVGGLNTDFYFYNRIGKDDWHFAKFLGDESWQGLKFYADPDSGGAETAYINASDGTASFTNVVLFTHGEGNPVSTPTPLVGFYRDDTNGNLFAWNGIEWGLITLGALPT